MATIIKLPNITESDYEAIYGLLKGRLPPIPSTYAKWLDQRTKWLEEHTENTVIEVDVDPKKLDMFLHRARHTDAMNTLFDDIDTAEFKVTAAIGLSQQP